MVTQRDMGVSASVPSEEQAEEVRQAWDASVRRAAAAIAQADVLLLLTGAGWSADSGLAVYKDVADVDAYRSRGLTYGKICEPRWLEDDSDLFYGFWGKCFNDYRDAKEHEGYRIVRAWRDQRFTHSKVADALRARHGTKAGAFFSFTSNVDAHHARTFGADEVRECHGNAETWQCSDRQCSPGRRWAAPEGFRFAVDASTCLASASRSPVGRGGQEDGFVGNHPVCPRCGKGLRPSILMFADDHWIDDAAQKERWRAWRGSVEAQVKAAAAQGQEGERPPLRVAILEVGAGGNVTTLRQLAEDFLESVLDNGGEATLIRVNPDLFLADKGYNQQATISLPGTGLAAVKQIDAELRALEKLGVAGVQAAEGRPLELATVPTVPRPPKSPPRKAETSEEEERARKGGIAPSTPEEMQKVRDVFAAIDTDGSGTLDRDEVARAAHELGRWELLGKALDEAMDKMDADKDGKVDVEEFCAWWEAGGKLSAADRFELMWAQFNARFDRVLSGALDGVAGAR